MWIDARNSEGKLLFRYDPTRELIETCERGRVVITDLLQLKGSNASLFSPPLSVPNADLERRRAS
jgi:hypothetical protein